MDRGMNKPEEQNRQSLKWFFLLLFLIAGFVLFRYVGKDKDGIVSPGELSYLHADVRGVGNCVKCHPWGGLNNHVCEACHKDITAAVGTKNGLHFKVRSQPCVKCHTDHKGATFTMVEWDYKKFDHSNIGYDLLAAHLKTPCEKCHKTRTKAGFQSYLGARGERCGGCHPDIHKGEFKQGCETCHNIETWKGRDVRFDHGKYYALGGGHSDLKCDKCHPDSKKTGLFKVAKYGTCSTPLCHDKGKLGDVHNGQFGPPRCDKCHGLKKFKPSTFRHSDPKYAGYRLLGKHAKTECAKCHRTNPLTKTVSYKPVNYSSCDAVGCHDVKERGNVHGAQFPGQPCELCHTENDWKYDQKLHDFTKFKLIRWHVKVKCQDCHKTKGVWTGLKPACSSCHYDPHKGEYAGGENGCGICHSLFRKLIRHPRPK